MLCSRLRNVRTPKECVKFARAIRRLAKSALHTATAVVFGIFTPAACARHVSSAVNGVDDCWGCLFCCHAEFRLWLQAGVRPISAC